MTELVTREEAERILGDPTRWGGTAVNLARTVVALHDQLDQTFRWQAGPAAENTALRQCIDYLWFKGCGIHTATDEDRRWYWVKNSERTPMTPEQQAVMEP